jgi:hypothetical protein
VADFDQDTLVRRGLRAQEILSDPMVVEAFTTLREGAIERWKRHNRPEEREEEWRYLRLVDALELHLSRVLATGRAEEERSRLAKSVRKIVGIR